MNNTAAVAARNVLAPVQTIAIAGGKGGVGKSCIAVSLARSLSEVGRKVLLFDADFSHGNVDCLLNLAPKNNLSHVLGEGLALEEAIFDAGNGLKVLPSGNGDMNLARLSQIEHVGIIGLFSELGIDADTMIIDIESGLTEGALNYSQAAREVVLVVCDEPTALQDAYSTIRVMHERCQIRRFRVVANKTESSRHGLDLYSKLTRYTDRYMDVLLDFCGSIPFDPQLQKSIGEQRVIVDAYPRSPSALAFKKLATRVNRWPRPTAAGGHVEFFVERLIQAACAPG